MYGGSLYLNKNILRISFPPFGKDDASRYPSLFVWVTYPGKVNRTSPRLADHHDSWNMRVSSACSPDLHSIFFFMYIRGLQLAKIIEETSMQDHILTLRKKINIHREMKQGNGLENLVAFYQDQFEIEENINHYNEIDFQIAKRKFVKYLMDHRTL